MNRRKFLAAGGASLAHAALPHAGWGAGRAEPHRTSADLKLRIEPCTLTIGRGVEIKTVGYNGKVPGPILRLRRDRPISIDVSNATRNPDIVHWHGLRTDDVNDGAFEEGSKLIAPGATLRYQLTPNPSGTRWYHSHAMAMEDLSLSTYTGQFGFLLVDGAPDPGHYDREVNLAIHHWEPHFVPMVDTLREESQNRPQTSGSDVGYKYATVNEHMLGFGEPIRVKRGERVLMRLLNASATENVVLALPGHTFRVIALDGNAVPNPAPVSILSLAVAERVDAIVEMNAPGVWVMGSTLKGARDIGLGVVIEYASQSGVPVWQDPPPGTWDYSRFANALTPALVSPVAETFNLTIADAGALDGSKFDTWTMNGDAWPKVKPLMVKEGKRYRLVFRNASGDQHPMHLHRHSFEVVKIGAKSLGGLVKDTVNVMPLQTVAVEFVADNPGDSLLHCHQQLHMDYGFMQMIKYTG